MRFTQYRAVKEVLLEVFNFDLSEESLNTQWDLCWSDTAISSSQITRLKPYQKINHYSAMYLISQKNHLASNIMKLKKVLPEDYAFYPKSWVLPSDWLTFRKQFNKPRVFIAKPEALSQGRGIFLSKALEDFHSTNSYVVQKYIKNPLLIEGYKFDLRIYVLVYGCDPLRIYIYNEGLVRLATESYVTPNTHNMDNLYIHLTNYAINKHSENYEFNLDADKASTGNKRSLSFIWEYIDSHGGDSIKIRNEINGIIVKTLCSIQPLLAHCYSLFHPLDTSNARCFEILGFDIIIDWKMKPWLLEVNRSPSFTTDTPFDRKIKYQLIEDTIRLLNMNPKKRMKYMQGKNLNIKLNKEYYIEKKRKKMLKRDLYEMSHLGNYTRIYPDTTNNDYYDKILLAVKELWKQSNWGKRRSNTLQKQQDTRRSLKKILPGKKSNVTIRNRRPLYYVKKDIESKMRLPLNFIAPNENEENKVQLSLFLESNIVDKIAKKYNIESTLCELILVNEDKKEVFHLPPIKTASKVSDSEETNRLLGNSVKKSFKEKFSNTLAVNKRLKYLKPSIQKDTTLDFIYPDINTKPPIVMPVDNNHKLLSLQDP